MDERGWKSPGVFQHAEESMEYDERTEIVTGTEGVGNGAFCRVYAKFIFKEERTFKIQSCSFVVSVCGCFIDPVIIAGYLFLVGTEVRTASCKYGNQCRFWKTRADDG